MGLETIVASKAQVSPFDALVLFNQGVHGSSLIPLPNPASTAEMQMQIAAYLESKGQHCQLPMKMYQQYWQLV